MTKGNEIINAHIRSAEFGGWTRLVDQIDQAITEARIAVADATPKPMTPVLQRDLIAALRAAVPKICLYCRSGWKLYVDGYHRYADGLYGHPCQSLAERTVLARIDAEGKNAE